MKSIRKLWNCTSGTALVEMTIITPLVLSLMIGGIDFAWGFSTYATGAKSVRNAARYLGSLPESTGCPGWAIDNAKNLAVTGQITGGTPLIPGWSTGDITVTCAGGIATVAGEFTYIPFIIASFLPIAASYRLHTQHEERQVGA
jgi:TadE-like protein